MANHCENTMTISGTSEDLASLREFAAGPNQGRLFSMEGFLPTPEDLLRYPAHNLDETINQHMRQKHGFPDWWQWRLHHWGTRADAYNVHLDQKSESSLTYRYLTAWSPFNGRAIAALSKRFPTLHVNVEYIEPLMAFEGRITAQEGKILEDHRQDFDFYERYQPAGQ